MLRAVPLPAELAPPGRTRPSLFDALPTLGRATPFVPLAHTPTPLVRAAPIADWLGSEQVWLKRDGLISPLYGGNKVRRYELILADAQAQGARTIVTAGGIASTQVMATALFGRALGFDVYAVLFDQPVTRFAKEAMRVDANAGAQLARGGGYVSTVVRTALAMRRSEKPYLILPGAANPLANIGYVDAMLELAQQVEAGVMPRPDVIVLPTGSSGTLAALALGAAHLGWHDTQIVGVRITLRIACNRLTIGAIMRSTDRWLEARDPRWKRQSERANWTLFHDALGPGYGHPTPESQEAIPVWETLAGVPGEVTYSAKALAVVRAMAKQARWANKTFLLWETLSAVRPPHGAGADSAIPGALRKVLDAPEVA